MTSTISQSKSHRHIAKDLDEQIAKTLLVIQRERQQKINRIQLIILQSRDQLSEIPALPDSKSLKSISLQIIYEVSDEIITEEILNKLMTQVFKIRKIDSIIFKNCVFGINRFSANEKEKIDLSTKTFGQFVERFHHCHWVTDLTLDGCLLNDDDTPSLVKIVNSMHLLSLVLSNNHLDKGAIDELGKALKENPSLHSLTISDNFSRGINLTEQFLTGLSYNRTLRKVKLSGISAAANQWRKFMESLLNNNRDLLELDFPTIVFGEVEVNDIKMLGESMGLIPNLRQLSLKSNRLSGAAISQFAQSYKEHLQSISKYEPALEVLDLTDNIFDDTTAGLLIGLSHQLSNATIEFSSEKLIKEGHLSKICATMLTECSGKAAKDDKLSKELLEARLQHKSIKQVLAERVKKLLDSGDNISEDPVLRCALIDVLEEEKMRQSRLAERRVIEGSPASREYFECFYKRMMDKIIPIFPITSGLLSPYISAQRMKALANTPVLGGIFESSAEAIRYGLEPRMFERFRNILDRYQTLTEAEEEMVTVAIWLTRQLVSGSLVKAQAIQHADALIEILKNSRPNTPGYIDPKVALEDCLAIDRPTASRFATPGSLNATILTLRSPFPASTSSPRAANGANQKAGQ